MTAADAYLPGNLQVAALAALLLLATAPAVIAIQRIRAIPVARVAAWALVITATLGMERLCAAQPAGFRMLAIIGTLLWSMKAVVLVEAAAVGERRPTSGRLVGFITAWPGMQPRPFAGAGEGARKGANRLIALGVRRAVAGLFLVALARLVWAVTGSHIVATVMLLPGLSLILHFGIFNLAAGGWRHLGVNAYQLFRAPLKSRSLTEFWGRRWNLAFTEMTALAVYRPLAVRYGPRHALLASFVCSGVLHELAISVPVQAGYGLPLLYFALHGGLMLIERALAASGRPLEGWHGRAWTLAWLVAPLPILFHLPFLQGVVWPIIGIGG